ncbi:hypothetical protein [Pseudomonas sp. 18173]|uniref:hypothetical protein n=1 Tax=Pseudomonas sp. 18173 TaxID=3390055 RepID=UPI003D1EA03B
MSDEYGEPYIDPEFPDMGPIRRKIIDVEEWRHKRDIALGKSVGPRKGAPKAKCREPFYMVQTKGLIALSAALNYHGPAILVALEVVRLEMTRRDEQYVLTEARVAALGISPKGLRTLKRHLVAADDWFLTGYSGRGALTIVLTEQGRERLCRRCK